MNEMKNRFGRGYRVRLRNNRRVEIYPSMDGTRDWFIRFKILENRKTREIRETDIVLSDEALRALCNSYALIRSPC